MDNGFNPSTAPVRTTATSSAYRRRSRRRAEQGASLIEIMVVLVILLIGVFLAIRIFPTGFSTLRANENRSMATRLAQRMIALAKGDASENLPQGVLAAYGDTVKGSPTFGQLVVDTTQDPDNLGIYDTTQPANVYFDNINRFHFIKGEQVKVPLPTTDALDGQSGALYTVKFGPIYMEQSRVGLRANAPANDDDDALFGSYLRVTGSPLTLINVDVSRSNAYLNLRAPQTCLVDYGNGEDDEGAFIMVPPRALAGRARPYRIFLASYSYEDNNGDLQTVSQVQVRVDDVDTTDAQSDYIWKPIPLDNTATATASDIVPGSLVITREFDRLGYTATWDADDPYQYKLAADNVTDAGGAAKTYANIGALIFNPAGGTYSEKTPYGERSFTAYIDYAVLDWHIIRDDLEVPSISFSTNGYIPIRTTLSPIKQAGDPQGDLSIYNNLYSDPNPAISYDIEVYDLARPQVRLQVGSYRKPRPSDDILIDYDPRGGSYRTGTLFANINADPRKVDGSTRAPVSRGSQLRVLYQAEGDWAVGLQKAYSEYRCPLRRDASNRSLLIPQARPTANKYDEFGIDGIGATAKVYFPGCDLDKSVSLSIQYQRQNGEWIKLNPVQVTLDGREPVPGSRTRIQYATGDIRPALPVGERTEFDNALQWRVAGPNGIGVATGTSVKARVIWHDTDASIKNWRVQDLDSNLTPAP